jgi:putative nucleotidyltransferase with HDIG domain
MAQVSEREEGKSKRLDMDGLRTSVRASLPEIEQISDPELREKVVEVHALALSETELTRIEDIPEIDYNTYQLPGGTIRDPLRNWTQAHHYRGVAQMALAIADAMEEVLGPLGINRDIVLAAGLCHDVGKAFEFSPANTARWRANPTAAGNPAIRHPVYGVHLALMVGLPEVVVHSIGAHSLHGEGALIESSLEGACVRYADHTFWKVLERVPRSD